MVKESWETMKETTAQRIMIQKPDGQLFNDNISDASDSKKNLGIGK